MRTGKIRLPLGLYVHSRTGLVIWYAWFCVGTVDCMMLLARLVLRLLPTCLP